MTATYHASLDGPFTADKYVAACAICKGGYVHGLAENIGKPEGPFPAHQECIARLAGEIANPRPRCPLQHGTAPAATRWPA